MIKTELLNDGTLIRHYSDAGFMLLQIETGLMYSDPVDIIPCRYTYEETDIPCDRAEDNGVMPEESDQITSEEFDNMLKEVL